MARIIHWNGTRYVRQSAGFSLIEVMVAVVVLATGLLALAALQGALARNSADAKARGAVAAALTSRMNEYRQTPPADGTASYACSGGNWICTAQTQGSIGGLTVAETVTTMVWKSGSFSAFAAGDDLTGALFKRVEMAAQWTDATGATKTMAFRSDVSDKVYGDGAGYPPGSDTNGSAAKTPIVRQTNPSNIAGVIPIVTGNQATAASNPQPIIEGANNNLRVGTSFDVLNYIPEGSTAKITKRFQTEVIKCRCEYGAGGYSVAGKAQWPTVWNGTAYSTYKGTGDATGVAKDAGEDADYAGSKGRLQSEQCTECCRDHHDDAATTAEARYDPEATGVGKFNESGGVLTAVTSGEYVAACRVIKVDGLWKTTADMYQRHYGLLETTPDSNGTQAKSGVPSTSASSNYQTFVKDYLSQYVGTPVAVPTNAQAMFNETARLLNSPTAILIATASASDWRYLHGRGLYVDYLTTAAQQAVGKCSTKTGTAYTECVLPVLPFTTINLTEMAIWTPTSDVLNTNSNKALTFNTSEPFGGRTTGVKLGTASNASAIRVSNSGVAISDNIKGAVDENGDLSSFTDSQLFIVGGVIGTGSKKIWVQPINHTNVIDATFSVFNPGEGCDSDDAGTEFLECSTDANLPANGVMTISNYNQVKTVSTPFGSRICVYEKQNGNENVSVEAFTTNVPTLEDYAVTAVSGDGQLQAATGSGKTEITTVTGMTISENTKLAPITVTFSSPTSTSATLASCTASKSGNKYYFKAATWTEAWAN